MKESLNSQFAAIYDLCNFILKSHVQSPGSVKSSKLGVTLVPFKISVGDVLRLISTTLNTLANFLEWIALGYVFETDLIQMLLVHFWDPLERPQGWG